MKRIFIYLYIIAAVALTFVTVINQTQPARFLVKALTAYNKYPSGLVVILTLLLFLSPLVIFLLIARYMRKEEEQIISPDRTGIFVTRKKSNQSALIGIPVYISEKKAGTVDNGQTKFFDMPSGTFTLQSGQGKRISEKIQTSISEGGQLCFEMEVIDTGGVYIEYRLTQL